MVSRRRSMNQKEFDRLRERLTDPLLTALTVMLAILMFVIAPLQAVGVFGAHHFGFAFALMLVVAVFVVSGSVVALTTTLFAVALVVVATILRLRQPSATDIYLDASAWLIAGLPQHWTNFRGAVLLRSTARPQCVYRPSAPFGQSCHSREPNLLQFRHSDLGRLWRHHSTASSCTQSRQYRIDHRPTVSSNTAGAPRHAGA
jgi:hypothetical protein